VAEGRWCPGVGLVAGAAVRRGGDVIGALAGCLGAVVARCAVTSDTRMNKCGGGPRSRLVAVFTDVACREVGCGSSRRLGAVVARRAIAGDPGMIEACPAPGVSGMTIGAIPCRG
jgi:hypothetical protein